MNYYDELKALLSSYLYTLFTSGEERSILLGYLLAREDRKRLVLTWYSLISSYCREHKIPYIEACVHLNNLPMYIEIINSTRNLESVINQLKKQ